MTLGNQGDTDCNLGILEGGYKRLLRFSNGEMLLRFNMLWHRNSKAHQTGGLSVRDATRASGARENRLGERQFW
jgi:hypothetical protein